MSAAAVGESSMEKPAEGVKLSGHVPTLEQLQNDPDSITLSTAPFDARFPNTNQTKNCWQNYVDYHMCVAAKGEDYKPCLYFKRIYKILCPMEWVSRWDDLVAEGKFASDTSAPDIDTLKKWSKHE